MSADFRECDTCAAKPGQPSLCAGCLHNRDLIRNAVRIPLRRHPHLHDAFIYLHGAFGGVALAHALGFI